ncbi:MAG: endonuclease domain-containing protein [Chloroflexi bacterium]|nr:endonuclease domain-containing protein [Chloroflexota bacterium]MBU1879231.1 endonuclease domain-containing protein [Chloroflexota bacterium]
MTAASDASAPCPVLVVVMNNQRDMDLVRTANWYRIPVRRAPQRLGADYLAFYQTGAFGEDERWQVRYYAPVRRVRRMRRRDLLPDEPDHPRAADEYYQFALGPLARLPRPIPSRRLRRITFIPTTLERLLAAREINDLWLGSEAEERLWAEFQAQGLPVERRAPLREDDEDYLVDFAVYCRRGRLAVLVAERAEPVAGVNIVRERPLAADYDLTAAGWTVLRFTAAEIRESPGRCVAAARALAGELGGPAD